MHIRKVTLAISNYIQSPTGALLFLLFCVMLITSFYLRDEAPSALAQEFKTKLNNQPSIPDAENSYIFLLGMDAPQNEDPVTQGIYKKAQIEKVAAGEPGDIEKLFQRDFSYRYTDSPEINKLRDNCKNPSDNICISSLNENDTAASEWLEREDWLLKRYMQLTSYRKYQGKVIGDLNMPLPNYGCALDGQKLLFMQLWLLSKKGEALRIQQMLNADAEYWRISLSSSNMLISKIIAAAALKRNLLFGNLLYKNISDTQKTATEMPLPASWEKSFTNQELSLNEALIGEWQLSSTLIINTKRMKEYVPRKGYKYAGVKHWSDMLVVCCLKPQMAINLFAEQISLFMNQFNVPLNQYPELKEKVAIQPIPPSRKNSDFVGYALIKAAMEAYTIYPYRISDLEGVRLAALATYNLRAIHINREQCQTYLKQSEIKNPYTNQPFECDTNTGVIIFNGLDDKERGHYEFLM